MAEKFPHRKLCLVTYEFNTDWGLERKVSANRQGRQENTVGPESVKQEKPPKPPRNALFARPFI